MSGKKKTAREIIANRVATVTDDQTGEVVAEGPVGGQQTGEADEGAPTSTPAAQTPQTKPSESGGEPTPSGEGGEGESVPRIPKSRLDEVIAQRNEARDDGKSKDEELESLRKEFADLQKKTKLSELKTGEGRPSNWDELSEVDKMIWLHERIGETETTESKPSTDPDVAMIKAERQLMLKGYSMEEAVILNEIMSSNPNLNSDQVMVLAAAQAPDLFAGDEGEGENGSHPSHTTSGPRTTRTTKIEEADPLPALKEKARNGRTRKERQAARLEIIKLARKHPIIETR